MTIEALHGIVRSGQREVGVVVIKVSFFFPVRVTRQAGCTVIGVAKYFVMFLICRWIGMTGDTGKRRVIVGVGVTIDTLVPFPIV